MAKDSTVKYTGPGLPEKREAELLDILYAEMHRRSLQKTVQTYLPCVWCGRTEHARHTFEFLPDKKGIMVKAARCLCGNKVFPRVEMVN